MAEAEEEAGVQTPELIPFDHDAYTCIADKGPITAFGLAGDTADTLWYNTFRIFGLRTGYSTVAGVPGFYLVNKANAAEDAAAVCYSLPAILHPADDGLAPVFGLYWKIGPNGNIYAVCLGTDLKQSSDNDGVDKWLNDKDAVPRRLDLFKAMQPIENRDGQPLAKKFDGWMKDHSSYFRELKIRSLIGARAWLNHSNFVRQSQVVYRNAEAAIRSVVKETSGGAADTSKSKKKSKQTTVVDPAISAEITRRSEVLDSAVQPLLKYMQTIAVPEGNRIIEVDFGAIEKEISPEELAALIQNASTGEEWSEAVVQLLKTSDKLKLLQTGQAKIAFHSSPFPTPFKKAPPSAAAVDECRENPANSDDSDAEPAGAYEFLHTKRKRIPVAPMDVEDAGPGKARVKPKVKEVIQLAQPTGTKRKYTKSGIHSKDPIVAAAARAGARMPSDSSEPGLHPAPPHTNPTNPACLPLYVSLTTPISHAHMPVPFNSICAMLSGSVATLGSLGSVVGSDQKKVKELKQRVSELEFKLAAAEAKMSGQAEIKEYAVQAAKYQMQIEMQKTVELAYEKGYSRCKDSMETNMNMLRSMRDA